MIKRPDGHTVLWVPRFWPSVGGTEFHSHELALRLSEEQRVTVVTHCTITESTQHPLAQLAAEAQFQEHNEGSLRTVTLAPHATKQTLLTFLGKHYEDSVIARRAYQLIFDHAFRESAMNLTTDADRIHCIYNGLTESAWLACDIAHKRNIPFIFTPQLYRRSSLIIALTEHEANWLASRGVDSTKIQILPYGPILTPSTELRADEPGSNLLQHRYILFLGRLVPGKGYQRLLDAFRLLAESDNNTSLVLVGPAEDSVFELIQAFNKELGQERVHLLQNVSQPLKTALIENAILMSVPSTRESLGGVYIEAMTCGIPVVALDRPVSRCVIDHEKDGLLVENTAQALASALASLINNPGLAHSMGMAGKAKVANRYAWPVIKKEMLNVYAQLDSLHQAEIRDAA